MATWAVYAFLSAATAAAVAVLAKLGLQKLDPTLATTIRTIVMAGLLVIFSLSLGKFEGFSLSLLTTREWLFILAAAISGTLSLLFYFFALKLGSATGVVAIDRLSLVFVVLLAVVFLGETLNWKIAIGATLMVAGALFISL